MKGNYHAAKSEALFVLFLTHWWPDSTRLMCVKCFLLRRCGVDVGVDVFIASSVRFRGDGKIRLEDRCHIAANVHIEASGSIVVGTNSYIMQASLLMANGKSKLIIGPNCQIAHFVSLKTSHHRIEPDAPCIGDDEVFSDIEICDGCWICAGATIIPGVKVGSHCVIAAGAVAIKDCEPYSLYAGCPATIKKRYARSETAITISGPQA